MYADEALTAHRYLLGVLGSNEQAEDALQEVFAKLVARRDSPRDPAAYFWQAVRNEARSWLRWRSRWRWEPEDVFPPASNPAWPIEDLLAVAAALRSLPRVQREVVILMTMQGFTAREAATRLGISPNTASSRLRLAMAKLRSQIRTESGERRDRE